MGASTATRREYANRHQIGVGSILWGNDFPHPEGTWPYTREWLGHVFADTPVNETRLMLGLAAAAEYDFDVAKLTPVARRIGPARPTSARTLGGRARPHSAAADRHWLAGPDIPEVARALATR